MGLEIIGHRGARGLFAENTLQGFENTLNLPLSGIELDIVVSKDKQLVVSHEPFMNHLFCLTPEGKEITPKIEKEHNLYTMNYDEIKTYDCGTKPNSLFSKQKTAKAHKPLLVEVFNVLNKCISSDYKLLFEVKSEHKWYGTYQPEPEEYAKLIVDFLALNPFKGELIIQSFDPILLNEIYTLSKHYKMGLLVENKESVTQNLAKLAFVPSYYNLYHKYVTEGNIALLSRQNIELIPWTVNTKKEAEHLNVLGIKSIITDYPTLF